MRILVVNVGSSSVKLRVLDDADLTLGAIDLPVQNGRPDTGLADAVAQLRPFDAVGHRVVHGGTRYIEPVFVDRTVLADLYALADLAPLHQPAALAALEAVTRAAPDEPTVACFDTAFHAHMPAAASTYAVPRAWRDRWPIRRFGFHGLSHAYAARRALELTSRPAASTRLVTCHLGAGASLAAIVAGRSVDTTMGFTPLEGLVMATRAGNVDPGLVLWLQQQEGLSAHEIHGALEHASGLKGLAGTADMAAVLAAAREGRDDARLAVDVYVHRLRAGIAAMVASLGGLDLLVFTGGVGEHAPSVRQQAADGLSFLGVDLDRDRNQRCTADAEVGVAGSVPTLVVQAREDLEIAAGVRAVLGARRAS
jgi:acetate kinase